METRGVEMLIQPKKDTLVQHELAKLKVLHRTT